MKFRTTILAMCGLLMAVGTACKGGDSAQQEQLYVGNRAPLQERPYIALPLGAIEARGWLLETLERQSAGLSSQMDVLYPEVVGERNGWLGGDGDQWERGPYWIDGLLPLAYILDDDQLKEKVKPWVEWALASQQESGFFGPTTDYEYERGLQRTWSHDWWPRMVVLKILQQHYSATGDQRVIDFMTKYFRYQLETLPTTPLGNWTFWAEYRACDNLQAVLWLYNITGDEWLLDLSDLLHEQSFDYTEFVLETDKLQKLNTIHCVNLAQGIKEPVIYWQHRPEQKYLDAVKQGFEDIRKYNGFANGMYGGDEALHGNNPTQGSELCSAVELMFSLEEMIKVTGDLDFVDHLEKVAFNALPTQITDDFMARQYFQQANQVKVSRSLHNFDINHGETDLVFGLLTGYPCCTCNFHQGWPKFTQNLWYATPDGGLAALVYSPSQVSAKVRGGVEVTITEDTCYPMDDKIKFNVALAEGVEEVCFPLSLRIPSWAKEATLTVNGEAVEAAVESGKVCVIERTWKSGDVVELTMPMSLKVDEWYEQSVSVERGPLVYAVKVGEKWIEKKFTDPADAIYGKTYFEVHPTTPWNYGLVYFDTNKPEEAMEVVVNQEKLANNWYWNLENNPIEIKVKAKRIPKWTLYNNMAGPLPYGRMIYGPSNKQEPVETITLVPYGCTTLRVSEIPLLEKER